MGRYPTLIRNIRIELSLEPVGRHDTGLAFTCPQPPVFSRRVISQRAGRVVFIVMRERCCKVSQGCSHTRPVARSLSGRNERADFLATQFVMTSPRIVSAVRRR
ncbi:hypothetical protein GCL04_09730 [Klebsiella pneumoniae]|nr:hypothetical protein GCL04_09730 [Klebsiella pneumoniae]